MELKSFREILLKKAADNPTLQTLINVMKDELIADKVIESLEKMARPHASMGRSANAGITAFGNQMKNKDVEMLRDALSHHVSHYKSALKNDNRKVADQHLNKIIPLMHLAARSSAHSGGQLGFDYVPLEPWESNYTTLERRPETGKLKEGTKGLRRRLNSVGRDKNERSVPDYRYLEMAPHHGHADVPKSKHKGGYPFEEIQIGNPSKIDSNSAYLHIEDVGPQESYTPHPFDHHPVHGVADTKQDSLNEEKMAQFADAMNSWHESDHNKKWMEGIKGHHAKDPKKFMERGKSKPAHHFEGLKLQDQPEHVKRHKVEAPEQTAPASLEVPAPKPPSNINLDALPAALKARFAKE